MSHSRPPRNLPNPALSAFLLNLRELLSVCQNLCADFCLPSFTHTGLPSFQARSALLFSSPALHWASPMDWNIPTYGLKTGEIVAWPKEGGGNRRRGELRRCSMNHCLSLGSCLGCLLLMGQGTKVGKVWEGGWVWLLFLRSLEYLCVAIWGCAGAVGIFVLIKYSALGSSACRWKLKARRFTGNMGWRWAEDTGEMPAYRGGLRGAWEEWWCDRRQSCSMEDVMGDQQVSSRSLVMCQGHIMWNRKCRVICVWRREREARQWKWLVETSLGWNFVGKMGQECGT